MTSTAFKIMCHFQLKLFSFTDIFYDIKLFIVRENGTVSYDSTNIEVVFIHALENIRISSHSEEAIIY